MSNDSFKESPICKVLETYFGLLGQFLYEKAKETVERERDALHKGPQHSMVLSSLLTALSQLAASEKNYTSLTFLVPKGFLRKDSSLKSMYEALRNEFSRLEERSRSKTPSPSPSLQQAHSPPLSISFSSTSSPMSTGTQFSVSVPFGSFTPSGSLGSGHSIQLHREEDIDELAGHLCSHLFHFVTARLEIMEFYDKLHTASSVRFIKFEELVNTITEIMTRSQKQFHHPLLSPLKSSFSLEGEVLQKLLEAQVKIQQWQFLSSLMLLHEAHTKLGAWAAQATGPREPRRTLTAIVRPSAIPPLYQWLYRLKSQLVSKFSLYYYQVLSKQTSAQEFKGLSSKASVDLYQKMVTFQRKTDALCVALVLDTFGLENFKGLGYHLPGKCLDPPKGLDSYPAIVCVPPEKPSNHWPNVIMIMNDKSKELNNSDHPVCFYDTHVQTTYFLVRVEPSLTLAVILESRKNERDNTIISFMQEICGHLRCNSVLAALKPGSK